MNSKECEKQLKSLIEHFNNGGLDFNATDIKAIEHLMLENQIQHQTINELRIKVSSREEINNKIMEIINLNQYSYGYQILDEIQKEIIDGILGGDVDDENLMRSICCDFSNLNDEIEIIEENEKIDDFIMIDPNGYIHTIEGSWKGRKMDVAIVNILIKLMDKVNKLTKEDK